MQLLPERAQSLEEWREKIYFPGGFREWCIRYSGPDWSLTNPLSKAEQESLQALEKELKEHPRSKFEQEGWYDAVMHERYYPSG